MRDLKCARSSAPAIDNLAAAMALIALAAFGGCRRGAAESDEGPAAAKRVRCARAEARELRDEVQLHGTVAPLPDRDALIAPQVAGRIARLLVREGDHVARGQPLARIDDAALLDQAKQAAAQLAKARAEVNLASLTRARIQRVYDRGIAARQELDDVEARLATAQAGEADLRAAAQIAHRQIERADVRSPLDGVVLKVLRRPGELVDGTPATPIVEVGDPARLELVATATAADLVRLRAADPAEIELPALPELRLRGTIAAVSPSVDRASGLGVVRVALALGSVRPPVGITGTARVGVGSPRHALVVPAAALRAVIGGDGEVIVCGPDHRAHVVRVRTGVAAGGLAEIRWPADGGGERGADGGAPPVAPGASVAVEPVLGLSDGDAIETAP
jgi:RND family efflux transporter MFP subunit